MAARRKRYTREFKLEAIRLVDGSSHPVAEIARELGVTPTMLSRWRRQLGVGASEAGDAARGGREAQELARLRRENAVLKQERDFLKKAAAFFAQESP
jgi:transposase-like protein